MIRLHLVGFTTDLKNLIFSRTKGAKSGSFMIGIDTRLRRTLEEVARLEAEQKAHAPRKTPAPSPASKLTPKEIQGLLRKGRSLSDVAKLAETDVAWIERFATPVIAERAGVVDAVRAAFVTKPRLGLSSQPVWDSILANLRERKVNIAPAELDDGWNARLRDGRWEVTLRYVSRGKRREAAFTYDTGTRTVAAANALARDIAWRAEATPSRRTPKPRSKARTRRRRGRR